MPRLSSAEVFTPTSFPTYTYVTRDELHHDQKNVLVLTDPYLLFYLRWSGILEREADGAG